MKSVAFGLGLLLLATATAAQLPFPAPTPPAETQPAEAPSVPVEAEVDLTKDRHIAERLEATFGLLERFSCLRVGVRAGVVELGGTVADARARQDAEALAKQVEGVVAVNNTVGVERNLRRRLQMVTEELLATAYDAIAFLPLLAVALLIVALFWGLGYAITRWIWLFARVSDNVFLQNVLRQAVLLTLLVVGAVLALRLLDAVALVSAILGAVGLIGLVLGLGFRDLAENFISGILLSLRQPFLPYDIVVVEGYEGKVIRLTSRATIILTYDGNHVRIPNSTVFKGIVRNLTRNPARRLDFAVGMAYETDLTHARNVGIDAMRAMEAVLEDPAPDAWVEGLADWSIPVRYVAWIDSRNTDFIKAKGEAIRIVKEALDAADVCMPVPIYDLNLKRPGPAPALPTSAPSLRLEADIAADAHLDKQVSEERAASSEPDLLNPTEPRKD